MKNLTRLTLSFLSFALLGATAAVADHHGDMREGEHAKKHAKAEGKHDDKHKKMHPGKDIDTLVAVMMPTEGNNVSGTVTFEAVGKKEVRVTADITGLNPNSEHAIHVHEYGDIRAADGTAAGGHYNPKGHEHGLPDEEKRHAGDFGNLSADENGEASFTLTVDNLSLFGKKNPIIGRAVIIHAQPDDGGQPTGNAGARLAQGVIGVLNPEH